MAPRPLFKPHPALAHAICDDRLDGLSISKICKNRGLGVGTITRWLQRPATLDLMEQRRALREARLAAGHPAATSGTTASTSRAPALRRTRAGTLERAPVEPAVRAPAVDGGAAPLRITSRRDADGSITIRATGGSGQGMIDHGAFMRLNGHLPGAMPDDVLFRGEFYSPSGAAPEGFHTARNPDADREEGLR